MHSVLLCDDNQYFREGVEKVINEFSNCHVEGHASCSDELFCLLENNAISDLILLDVNLTKGLNGYEITKSLRKKFPELLIIGFSMHCDEKVVAGMISYGANGFICKSSPITLLHKGICNVVNGDYFIDPNIQITSFKLKYNPENKSPILTLSKRELHIAKLMASEKAYKQIADDLKISPNTLENIRTRIFKKMNVQTRTELVLMLLKVGLLNLFDI
jgi:DNA-binding NarL/FixJ family response regulator